MYSIFKVLKEFILYVQNIQSFFKGLHNSKIKIFTSFGKVFFDFDVTFATLLFFFAFSYLNDDTLMTSF